MWRAIKGEHPANKIIALTNIGSVDQIFYSNEYFHWCFRMVLLEKEIDESVGLQNIFIKIANIVI